MFARLFQKNAQQQQQQEREEQDDHHRRQQQAQTLLGSLRSADLNPRIEIHYGIPATASVLAFDAIQSLLAVGTLDGRIKVIGGDNIEALLVSPKQLPFKNLEFLQNQGFLASISKENDIQVWDLEDRQLASALQWESNITAFSVICGTSYMYVGDEYGMVSVLKYDSGERKLVLLPYYIPSNSITEASGISLHNHSIVGILPQPCSQGNRLLMAYENGLIVIWDVSEDRVVMLRGNKVLEMKSEVVADYLEGTSKLQSDEISEDEQVEREISSLCWASTNASILAVGYVDGDIMFWEVSTAASSKDRQTENSSTNVVKLQLSSRAKRLPVIVLHWSAHGLHNDCGGQLFVYGGDEGGSEEIITILNLDHSSGIQCLKCIGRVDLRLNGSFADMVLSPCAYTMGSSSTMLLVLTNPGELHIYNDVCLSELMSQEGKASSVPSIQYHSFIPTVEPRMMTAKLGMVYREGKLSRALSEIVSAVTFRASQNRTVSTEFPLSGGVPSLHFSAKDYQIERIYTAGYHDGSVRIWDATHPTLSPIYVLGSELEGIEFAGSNASISVLEFCSFTLRLAVGNESGIVRLYNLIRSPDETSLNFVMETERKVHILPQGDGPQCTAIFSFLSSPVCSLQFANFCSRLAIGFKCGRVAMVDTSSLSVLYLTENVSSSSSPLHSLAVKSFSEVSNSVSIPKNAESKCLGDPETWELFIMTKDAHVIVCDGTNGNIIVSQTIYPEKESTAVSMYIIDKGEPSSEYSYDKLSLNLSESGEAKAETTQCDAHYGSAPLESEMPIQSTHIEQRLAKFIVLLCCEDALCLYPFKSVYQENCDSFREVSLSKPCCWTATIKKEEKYCALVVFYRTGEIETRSLPNLEVLGECSLMSILRWKFKNDMENTTCSSDGGHIMLVNGTEFATISLLASENDFRIPASLPCLHDAAAAFAHATAISSPSEKKIEGSAPGFLGGIIGGFNVGKLEENVNLTEVRKNNFAHLEGIFSYPPFLKPSQSVMDDQDVVELNIDDIQIDGPVVSSSYSKTSKNDAREKETERERLFEGATTDTRPKARTAEEIRAKYRKEDASTAAARAKDKLIQRQEKLERLSLRTEELQSGAENFASTANELAKTMEKRKWWNI